MDLNASTTRSPLHSAITRGAPDVVSVLLKHGARADHYSVNGTNALALAASQSTSGGTEILRLLLASLKDEPEQLSDALSSTASPVGRTPLRAAACVGNIESMISILQTGACTTTDVGDALRHLSLRLKLAVNSSRSTSDIDPAPGATVSDHRPFEKYLFNESLADVRLIVDGHSIPAHRVILAACSSWFTTLFEGGFSESSADEVTLEDVDHQTMKALLRWCYTGTTGVTAVDLNTWAKILATASAWVMPQLTLVAEHTLGSQLTADTVVELYRYAVDLGSKTLTAATRHRLIEEYDGLEDDDRALALAVLEQLKAST